MDSVIIGYLAVVILILVIFTGVPIGVAMGLIGLIGMIYISGPMAGLSLLERVPYDTMANYDMSVVPLFILMGSICYFGGISQDLFYAAYKWLGGLKGGLAMATITACAAFAAVSGSSIATAVTMGTVALPEMKKYKYDMRLATGTIAAGGTIGILIPPSIIFMIYGIITQNSIGKLFIAGFIPGIIETLLFIVAIYIMCSFNSRLGPAGPKTKFIEKIVILKNTWAVAALFLIVLGGLYFGWFSPTEGAGIGAFGAFIFAILRGKLSWKTFYDSLLDTAKTTGMVFIIVIGANMLGYFIAVTQMPNALAQTISTLPVHPIIIMLLIILIYLFLGCVMDTMAMVLLTVPIFYPVVIKLGFDPIWFGVIIVMVSEMGLITPPVGLNVYVIKGIARDVPMYDIFQGIMPFLIADVLLVLVLIFVPEIALFLPNLMK
jgi:C4-dicarboxylate transporter, DctM subunit